ncbi:MAG: RsmB/NOP family class I SAM-dependent RNA methyltransferase [Candidatus Aenigmatarchaeota archaeon]
MIPKLLEEKIKLLYPENLEDFNKIHVIKKSIRVNTLKISKKELVSRLRERFEIEEIPWCEDGLFVNDVNLTKTREYFLGYYYLQDAASMIPAIVLKPKKDDVVLDIAAAPGSKTTQMAAIMKNKGLIIANDVNMKRLKALRFNLQKCGVVNTVVTNLDGRYIDKIGIEFDKILLDVPCSASGTCITNPNVFKTWNQGKVNELSKLQKRLIEAAANCLKEGGEMVYSTCSIDPEENEEVIDFAVRKLNLKTKKIRLKGIKTRDAIEKYRRFEYSEEVKNAVRINPFDNMTEGFFICKLKKY